MTNRYLFSAVIASSVVLAGCFDGSSNSSSEVPANPVTSQVRVLHAVSDAPDVNVNVNGDPAVSGASFRQAGILNPEVGTYSVSVDAILPNESLIPVIPDTDLTLVEGTNYDVIAAGTTMDENIAPIVLEDDGQRDDPDSVRLRVVHVSPGAQTAAGGPVDIYITADGAPLPDMPLETLAFGEDFGPSEVGPGTYQVRITPAGTPANVVYDSGPLPLSAGSDLLVAAIDNTLFGDLDQAESPVNLLVVNGDETTELYDVRTGGAIRVAHTSSDAGAIDVYLNGDPTASTPIIENLTFGGTGPGAPATGNYAPVDVGENLLDITPAGNDAQLVLSAELNAANGQLQTVLAAGSDLMDSVAALPFDDDNRRIATEARLRVIHGAVEAPIVNVYAIPTAETGAGDTQIGNAMPLRGNFEYGESTGYLSVAEGDYVIFITDPDGNELFKSNNVSLINGGVYTAVARLNDNQTQGADVAAVTLMDDFIIE
jgi:outer membrane murein-binding lipoprotein Lpp